MMKNLKNYLLIALLSLGSQMARADEGMWLLPLIQQLNIGTMNELGFKLSANDIYSINQSSMKDAVIIFGNGCTGEMVSDQGLIFTNHHCGYGAIQQHSTVEHDYLKDGFWAKNKAEEIPSPGLKAVFLIRIEDVTDSIQAQLLDTMSETTRKLKIAEVSKRLEQKATKGTKYTALIKPFFSGNQFIMFVNQTFTDIRFVGAPPSSIGKFGADTDNWMWPRQTGDFSIFRVYADADGNPAAYSKTNVPYKPKYHLPISLAGVQKGDFAMTIGYPGSTDRYLSSWGIEERMNVINKARIDVRGVKQAIWLKDMQADPKVRIQYASKYAGSSNYWKNSIGMNKGLENLKVLDRKRELENQFNQWVNADPTRKGEYGNTLNHLKDGYSKEADATKATYNLSETLINGTEIFLMAGKIDAFLKDEKKRTSGEYEEFIHQLYKDYHVPTDKKVLSAMLKTYAETVDPQYYPSIYQEINGKFKGNYEKYTNYVFSKSLFTSEDKVANLENAPATKWEKDPAIVAYQSILSKSKEFAQMREPYLEEISKGKREFERGLKAMMVSKVFYPDANFTMRLSYGVVGDYEPRDGVRYDYFTTLKGVMEKEDPNNWEFVVPQKLKELYNAQDYGQYVDADGSMHVCFTTNNDITGGNSGSPVINGQGQLIGLAFDGNWEAMSGDIAFEPKLQKCINVDIRYVLFIIDKYAGASNLIDELTLVK